MSGTAEYMIGAEVTCADGACGKLSRVVLDPVARVITHLVVEPKHRPALGRLVPADLVDAEGERIHLRCAMAEFELLEDAEETHFLSEADTQSGYGAQEVFSWPYYGLGGGLEGMGMGASPHLVSYDRVPPGEVEVCRGDQVHALDGRIGRVQGLVIDPADHHVTHVLLQDGHLWGKREIAVPIGAVKDVLGDGVRLTLTRDQVRDLPAVALEHRA